MFLLFLSLVARSSHSGADIGRQIVFVIVTRQPIWPAQQRLGPGVSDYLASCPRIEQRQLRWNKVRLWCVTNIQFLYSQ